MIRYGLIGIVLAGAVAAISLAAPTPQGGGGGMGMGAAGGMRGPMMGARLWAMTGDVAVANGNVYVVTGNKLMKLGSDLKPVASVQLPRPHRMRGMMGGQRGGMMQGRQGPPGGGGQGPNAGPNMMRMSGMMASMMSNAAHLDADANGVYVLRGGELTVYDTNLKQTKSADVAQEAQKAE